MIAVMRCISCDQVIIAQPYIRTIRRQTDNLTSKGNEGIIMIDIQRVALKPLSD